MPQNLCCLGHPCRRLAAASLTQARLSSRGYISRAPCGCAASQHARQRSCPSQDIYAAKKKQKTTACSLAAHANITAQAVCYLAANLGTICARRRRACNGLCALWQGPELNLVAVAQRDDHVAPQPDAASDGDDALHLAVRCIQLLVCRDQTGLVSLAACFCRRLAERDHMSSTSHERWSLACAEHGQGSSICSRCKA